jgi:histidinol-phosphate aminotransferase
LTNSQSGVSIKNTHNGIIKGGIVVDIQTLANSGALRTKVYVPGKSKQEVQRELGLSHIIKMASNESAIGSSELAKKAYLELSEELHVYPDSVSRDLRSKLSDQLGCPQENITVSNGEDGVIYNLGMAIINEGDEAIIPEVTFPLYETIVKVMRGVPVKSGMKGFRIDLQSILDTVTGRTKVIFLCNPNNPTGDAQDREELLDFFKKVPDHILVVMDEAYIEFTASEAYPDTIEIFNKGMDNLFILRSFSKIYGLAGIRAGFGVGHKDIIDLIHRIKPPFNVSIVGENVALAALDDIDFKNRVLSEMKNEKARYYKTLNEMNLEYIISHTNFILIDTGRAAKEVFQTLLQKGIIVRPCNGFGLDTCIRITIGTHDENTAFLDAFKELMSR